MFAPLHTISKDNDSEVSQQRIPLIETKNGGKVVILTGATGLAHFSGVTDFFSKMTSNRLAYANKHGTPSLPQLVRLIAILLCCFRMGN